MSRELWRAIPGSEGTYEVSSHGRVRSLERVVTSPMRSPFRAPGMVLSPGLAGPRSGTQYLAVSLRSPGHRSCRKVHQLVLEAFVGPRPDGMVACHNDGDPLNNHLDNLRWDTQGQNLLDRRRHGTAPLGEKSPLSKLSDAQRIDIARRRAAGEGGSALAREFNVSPATVCRLHKLAQVEDLYPVTITVTK